MGDNIKYEEVEGIKCEIKSPTRRATVKYYQSSLAEELDKYIASIDRWTESTKGYRDNIKINIKVAPFVLGWLRKPTDQDEYLVIKGYMTLEELQSKRDKASGKVKKKPAKTRKAKIGVTRKGNSDTVKPKAKRPAGPKKPTAPKKPVSPKRPTAPKKPVVKKTTATKKAAPKKAAPKKK